MDKERFKKISMARVAKNHKVKVAEIHEGFNPNGIYACTVEFRKFNDNGKGICSSYVREYYNKGNIEVVDFSEFVYNEKTKQLTKNPIYTHTHTVEEEKKVEKEQRPLQSFHDYIKFRGL